MEMQDKEFDELFRSKLDDFEVEPSAGVWTGIQNELAAGKRRNYLFPFLSVAASILILVTAGVLFFPRHVKIGGKKFTQNRIIKTAPPANTNIPHTDELASALGHKTNPNRAVVALNKDRQHRAKATGVVQRGLLATNKTGTEQPVRADDHPVLASTPQKQQETIKSVVPDEYTELTINHAVEETPVLIAKPLMATQLPIINKKDEMPVRPKHRIRSLGDFLNVVVATVDKRRDKIIEFSNTDDDESTVTGVNLGVIKIKKDK